MEKVTKRRRIENDDVFVLMAMKMSSFTNGINLNRRMKCIAQHLVFAAATSHIKRECNYKYWQMNNNYTHVSLYSENNKPT